MAEVSPGHKTKQRMIKFCGEGDVQPDPSKVLALKLMAPPTSRQELQTFLGLATYIGPFIQVRESSGFDCNPSYEQTLTAIKNAINEEAAVA